MSNAPTLHEAKDAYRDAASFMLFLFRDETENMKAITDANPDAGRLLSGMIAVCAMIIQKSFDDAAVPMLESLVEYLANIPDEDWAQVAGNSRIVGGE